MPTLAPYKWLFLLTTTVIVMAVIFGVVLFSSRSKEGKELDMAIEFNFRAEMKSQDQKPAPNSD